MLGNFENKNIENLQETADLPSEINDISINELPDEISIFDNTLPDEVDDTSSKQHLDLNSANEVDYNENRTENNKYADLSEEEKQLIADKVAQDYNAEKRPYERGVEKGIEGLKQTENGGVSFEDTDDIYIKDDGSKCIVKIEATGNRTNDFNAANKEAGLEDTPDGYVWHHVDDYNVKDGTVTLELVKVETHNATKPHSGGCAMYDAVNGPSYNPPRKGE